MMQNLRNIPFGKPMIGSEEKDAVLEVLNGNILVHGPKAKNFEEQFAGYSGAQYAVSVSSCTAALHLSYFYFGISSGDEVIVPAMTHTATAHAVELSGAKPIFIDAEDKTGNINISLIEQNITDKTKAISIVHFLGMPVNMDQLMNICKKYNLILIEDCALALGAKYKKKHVGTFGDTGCFSFYPVKHITTSEGGMVLTNRKNIAEKITRQRAFGVDRTPSERSIPGSYDVNMLGYNYRMSEINAAIGIEQIKKANDFLKKREANYNYLQNGLAEINELTLLKSSYGEFKSSYYCLSVILNEVYKDKRFEIVKYLKEAEIGTSIYYPEAVPNFSYYQSKYGYKSGMFPIAEKISKRSIALPVGPHLNCEDMDYIIKNLKAAIVEVK